MGYSWTVTLQKYKSNLLQGSHRCDTGVFNHRRKVVLKCVKLDQADSLALLIGYYQVLGRKQGRLERIKKGTGVNGAETGSKI